MPRSDRRRTRRMLAAMTLAGLGLSPAAMGQREQPTIPPRRPPEPIAPNTPPGGGSVSPANPQAPDTSIPGLDDRDFRIGQAPLRSEGTFLVERRGSILNLPTGERIFVFFADPQNRRERPMVLAPCSTLQRMEQVAADREEPVVFVVSGQVLAYGSVNYLLPTKFSTVGPQSSDPAGPKPEAPLPGVQPNRDPTVQEFLQELEAQREQSRGPGPKAKDVGADQSAGRSIPTTPIAEDQMLLRRRGRLVRSLQGQWALVFDSGPGAEGLSDRPLLVIPCLLLQRMEGWASLKGEDATFEVSGRVLAYRGRNYLLPTMYQVYPTNDLEPRQ